MSSAKRILDNPLQKVVIYFLRLLSGCSPNTCSWSLLREFDFWPTQMDWVRLCARFWNCNIVGPGLQGTLLNNDVSLFLRGSTSCWAAKFLACMCTLGLIEGQSTYTLRQQNPLYFTRLKFSEEDVVRACKLLYESRWPSPVLDPRLAPHSGAKRCKYFSWCHDPNTEVQMHLKHDIPVRERRCLMRFRLHSWRLRCYDHSIANRTLRTCTFSECDPDMEDERHVLFTCCRYNAIRSDYQHLFTATPAGDVHGFLNQNNQGSVAKFLTSVHDIRFA